MLGAKATSVISFTVNESCAGAEHWVGEMQLLAFSW